MLGWEPALLESIILAFIRLSAALAVMPLFGYTAVPFQVRFGLAFILALMLAPVFKPQGALPIGVSAALTAAAAEAMVGLVFGLVTTLILVGAEFAGSLIGVQMGFAIVNVIDPQFGEQVSIIGRLEYLVALIIFLALDIHLVFLAALGDTFQLIPIGAFVAPASLALDYSRLTAEVFVIAVKLAAPVLAMLLLADIALAFMARMMPQMNVFFVGFPLKVGLGLFGLAVSWPLFVTVMLKVFSLFESGLGRMMGKLAVP